MPPSVRDTDNSWHDCIGDLNRNLERTAARSDSSHIPINQLKMSGILGMYEKHVPIAKGQALLERGEQTLYILHYWLRSQLDFTRWRSQYFRDTWLKRAKIDAVWVSFQHFQAHSIMSAKCIAIWAAAQ